jgi:uncharacterized membrane protein
MNWREPLEAEGREQSNRMAAACFARYRFAKREDHRMSGSRAPKHAPRAIPQQNGAEVSVLRLARPAVLPLWFIPTIYVALSVAAGLTVPPLEYAYLPGHSDMSAAAAIACFSAVASGSMAFTGIVFAVAFVVVQFSAVAYSPRLVVMLAGTPRLYHTLGLFFATFTYSLAALMWTDRRGSGATPLVSTYIVVLLLIASMLAFARLIQMIQELQIQTVLQTIGARGRAVITAMFPPASKVGAEASEGDDLLAGLPPAQGIFTYAGAPLAIAKLDLDRLVGVARAAEAVIVVECAVGDTLLEDAVLFRVHGARSAELSPHALRRTVHLAPSRTFEQDPKYAIRLLVDVAIRALSPAVNDPTTAVQALDQIEDLLGRLGRSHLDAGYACDETGAIRVVFPAPTWNDYLELSFDEIRQFGAQSLQVTRRLRAALTSLAASIPDAQRRAAILHYLSHLDENVQSSAFDAKDRATSMQEDRQGLGLTREQAQAWPHGDRASLS